MNRNCAFTASQRALATATAAAHSQDVRGEVEPEIIEMIYNIQREKVLIRATLVLSAAITYLVALLAPVVEHFRWVMPESHALQWEMGHRVLHIHEYR